MGFSCKDKPALTTGGVGEYLPKPPPPPSSQGAQYTRGDEEESLAQVEGHLAPPKWFLGGERELKSWVRLLYLPSRHTSGPGYPTRSQKTK